MPIPPSVWGYGIGGGQGMWGHGGREHAWVDTLARRFADRPNLFFYTITNEFERYPDGRYQYDAAAKTIQQYLPFRCLQLCPQTRQRRMVGT